MMQTFVGISRKYGEKQTEMNVYGKGEGGWHGCKVAVQ